jgi:hypothetical protein
MTDHTTKVNGRRHSCRILAMRVHRHLLDVTLRISDECLCDPPFKTEPWGFLWQCQGDSILLPWPTINRALLAERRRKSHAA